MQLVGSLYLLSLTLLPTLRVAAAHPPWQTKLPLPTKLIHQFSNPTWVENIAVRSNGQLLVTLLNVPELYLFDPTKSNPDPVLIASFPEALGLLGIAELEHDTFYVVVGNFSIAQGIAGIGSYSVWQVALDESRYFHETEPKISPHAAIKRIAEIPDAAFLNGMTAVPGSPHIILIADSTLGAVWRLNVKTGKYAIVMSEPEMLAPPTTGLELGINGVHIRDSYLYFSNTNGKLFGRIKIDTDGKAVGKVEVIASGVAIDDFTLDEHGGAWVDENFSNKLAAVDIKNGNQKIVAGSLDQLTLAGLTSSAFGRTHLDSNVLYIVTCGAKVFPVNGTITEGGKVVSVNTKGLKAHNFLLDQST